MSELEESEEAKEEFVCERRAMIYLASPYSHPDESVRIERFKAVNKAAAILISRGEIIYSAISHTHPIAIEADMPLGWEFWQRIDHYYLNLCEKMIVLMLPGWETSEGVKAEIEFVARLGKPVEYMEPR